MKRPVIDEFVQEEGSVYEESVETKQKIVFFQDHYENLILRSMFEEDIEAITPIKRLNSRRKK